MRKVMVLAMMMVAGACASTTSSSQVTPSAEASPSLAGPALDLDGTWVAQVTAADVEDTLTDSGLDSWADELGRDLAAPVTLTIDGGAYTVEVGNEAVNGGTYELEGTTLKLEVDPNGLTLLDAQLDGDDLTFVFTSNSTQDYPPDTAPEEAVQRALFTSVPFVRS